MGKSFYFVNGASKDNVKESREKRRHVMIGKNAGKTIHRPSRIKILEEKAREEKLNAQKSSTLATRSTNARGTKRVLSNPDPWSQVSTELPSHAFPVKLTPQYLEVISDFFHHVAHGMYPSHIGVSMDSTKRSWLHILMMKPDSFHCSVALMQACNSMFLYERLDSWTSTMFLTKSVTHVRQKIEGPDALSSDTVALVLSLVTQEQFRGQHQASRVHLDGLIRMIQLRGGLATLEDMLQVLLKVCKTDILFALEYGNAPVFHRDRMLQVRTMYKLNNLSRNVSPHMYRMLPPTETPIFTILMDVLDICALFNHPGDRHFEVDLDAYQEFMISIAYRLLSLDLTNQQQPLYPTQESIYQIGLTIFMMTMFLQYGRRRLHRFTRITQLLKRGVEAHSLHEDKDQMLWLMVLGGIWMMDGVWDLDEHTGEWLPPLVTELAQEMGVRSWDDALSRIGKYPWIHKLHDEPGRLIWEKVYLVRE